MTNYLSKQDNTSYIYFKHNQRQNGAAYFVLITLLIRDKRSVDEEINYYFFYSILIITIRLKALQFPASNERKTLSHIQNNIIGSRCSI